MSVSQFEKFEQAIGDEDSWPEMTDDPIINFYIDVKMGLEEICDWEELTDFEKEMYVEEALDIAENG